MNLRFSWDKRKNALNELKHGVIFEDAVMVFSDPMRFEVFDWNHSTAEDRWKTIGFAGVTMLVVICTEKDGIIRLISARKANKKEMKEYFNGYGTFYTD